MTKVILLTGLSGAGKTTIAKALKKEFANYGNKLVILDGDAFRKGLCCDLGYSGFERVEQQRRLREVAKLVYEQGLDVVLSTIAPFGEDRDKLRELFGDDYVEVYVKCPISICEERDVKGLYAKARKGEIKNFTGISQQYIEPIDPHVVIETHIEPVSLAVDKIINWVWK